MTYIWFNFYSYSCLLNIFVGWHMVEMAPKETVYFVINRSRAGRDVTKITWINPKSWPVVDVSTSARNWHILGFSTSSWARVTCWSVIYLPSICNFLAIYLLYIFHILSYICHICAIYMYNNHNHNQMFNCKSIKLVLYSLIPLLT